MEYVVLNDSKNSLKISAGEEVSVSYFSVFDSNTHESDSISLKFDREEFKRMLSVYDDNKSFSISNRYGHMSIIKTADGDSSIRLESSIPSNSFVVSGLAFDFDKLKEILV